MTVYVVQEPMKRDARTGEMIPSWDMTPAREYGDIEVMFPSGRVALSTQPMVQRARHLLRNFSDNDHVLLAGDPVLIGIVAAIASDFNRGRVKFLKWDRHTTSYLMVNVQLRT